MNIDASTWLVAALVVPPIGAMLAFVFGGRAAPRIALATSLAGVGISGALLWTLVRTGEPLVVRVGGWMPPLGITLRADGLAGLLMMASSLIVLAVAMSAGAEPSLRSPRPGVMFWVLLQAVAGALVAAFISSDLFSFYVALELLTFAAVPLVSLQGSAKTIDAALRYLLFALLGSLAYLLGVGIVYGLFGALDLGELSIRIAAAPERSSLLGAALALMIVGLLAKTALFPLHLWLPPAHAGAPPPASALLSALVVKGSYLIMVRLWFDLAPGSMPQGAAMFVGALGAGAILFGSAMALQQARLKMIIAYSTLAQLGYLFLLFPLARGDTFEAAFAGASLQAVSHAFAKSAMFLGAGLLAARFGSDRLDSLRGAMRAMPLTVAAIVMAGLSLVGLPPSGGFWAKWLLLTAAVESGQWWWSITMLLGSALAVGYIWRVLSAMMEPGEQGPPDAVPLRSSVPGRAFRAAELAALGLALISLLLGLFAFVPVEVIGIGRAGGDALGGVAP